MPVNQLNLRNKFNLPKKNEELENTQNNAIFHLIQSSQCYLHKYQTKSHPTDNIYPISPAADSSILILPEVDIHVILILIRLVEFGVVNIPRVQD